MYRIPTERQETKGEIPTIERFHTEQTLKVYSFAVTTQVKLSGSELLFDRKGL